MREQWRPARGGSDERGNVGAQRVPAMHAHEGGNLGRRRKNARTVCYRLFPGKMGRDAGDPCRGDGSRDPTLCLKTVVSTRGRLLCSLPPSPPRCTPLQFARTKFHFLPVLDKKENPQFGSLDIVSSSKTGFLSLFVNSSSIHLPFNVTMPYRIAGICLSSDNYSSDPFSKGSLAFETRMDRLLDSEGGPVCIIQGMLRLNRPTKWRKSSLLQ